MYDLEMLRFLNERAHLRAVALANRDRSRSAVVEKPKEIIKPPPVFPLSILARKLLGGPPSLAYYIELFEQNETFTGFRDLVREYLPEYEVNIMAEDLNNRAQKFVHFFSNKFFPLNDAVADNFTILDLLCRIPTQPIGFSYESYHMFTDFRKGYILALSLIESPWDEDPLGTDPEEEEEDTMQGGRVPILEMVGELVGKGLASLIPDNGWPAGALRRMTDGTEFEGLGDFADWVHSTTGLYHLDARGESLEIGEEMDWSQEAVDELTYDWRMASEILDNIHRLALLLEEESDRTFKNLLGLLLDRQDLVIPKEQQSLPLG